MKKIYKSNNIGFCYGVRNAIKIASIVAKNPNIPKPIYLLGSLVHNHHVNEYFNNLGITILNGKSRLEMIQEINLGTVIFTAHGVSDEVKQIAHNKGLNIIDATCPYVERTLHEMKKAMAEGFDILFIGKNDHPETETALTLGDNVYIVNDALDISKIKKPILCHQTTMSSYDVESTYNKLKTNFVNLKKVKMVCNETEKRQKLILDLNTINFVNNSIVIIVGDKSSNNSTKLYEMAKRLNKCDTLFIDNISELDFIKLKDYTNFYLFGGTSTPKAIIDEIEFYINNINNIYEKTIYSKLTLEQYVK